MRVRKEVIRPGLYFYTDPDTGESRKLTVTRDGPGTSLQHFFESGKAMIAAELSIPVPVEHQPDALPLTPAEKAARRLLNNSGWVADYEIAPVLDEKGTPLLEDGKPVEALYGFADIEDPEVARKLHRTIRYTSPYIHSFTDGNNRKWENVISHLALTTRPRITRQQPFKYPSIAAALSAVLTTAPPAKGFSLSRAGLLKKDGTPAYPLAFSLYSGVALAETEMPKEEKKEPEKKEPPKKEGEGEKEPPPEEEALEDESGDIPLCEVVCDLLEAHDICLGECDEASFIPALYHALMANIKGEEEEEIDPMAGNPAVKPPVREEHPPQLYMSLEEANKITDPVMKGLALSMLKMQEETKKREEATTARLKAAEDANAALSANLVSQAKTHRAARLERIRRWLPDTEDARAKLKAVEDLAATPGMALSLGTDGKPADPLGPMLDVIEAGMRNIPELLTTPGINLAEIPHPREYQGQGVTEERRQAIVAELSMNGAIPTPKK